MDTGGTARTSSEDVRQHLDTARLAGVQEVWSFGDVISVAFPEADFVISLSSPGRWTPVRHRVGGHRARAAARA